MVTKIYTPTDTIEPHILDCIVRLSKELTEGEIQHLLTCTNNTLPRSFITDDRNNDNKQFIEQNRKKHNKIFITLQTDDTQRCIGLLSLEQVHRPFSLSYERNCMEISNVVVDPIYRRQHLGDILMEQASKIAKEAKMKLLILAVNNSNFKAIKLYRKHKFNIYRYAYIGRPTIERNTPTAFRIQIPSKYKLTNSIRDLIMTQLRQDAKECSLLDSYTTFGYELYKKIFCEKDTHILKIGKNYAVIYPTIDNFLVTAEILQVTKDMSKYMSSIMQYATKHLHCAWIDHMTYNSSLEQHFNKCGMKEYFYFLYKLL